MATATVSLAWDANTESDLSHYNLYQGLTSGGPYDPAINVGNVLTYDVTGLGAGTTYYWVLTAVDTSSNESGLSNEVSQLTPPSPVTDHIAPVVIMPNVVRIRHGAY